MRHVDSSLPLLPLVLDTVPHELREMLVQEGVPFCLRDERPPAGRFVLFDSRLKTRPSTSAGQVWIDLARLDDREIKTAFTTAADQRSGPHQWRIGGLTVTEEIARVDRRAIRRQLLGRLREAIEAAGGIWLCVSPYPSPYRSVFNFRVDHDEFDRHDFSATMHALQGYEAWTSHFVNAGFYEPAAEPWDVLRGLDVGSHGFWHHTYRTVEENLDNIRCGIDVLRAKGFEPHGFAAPGGRYNAALQTVLTMLDISHSGEFALAYDELPFVPVADGPLQVPVHPVCLGLFLEAAVAPHGASRAVQEARRRNAAATAAEYYEKLIHHRAHAGEPIFLYGHPQGRLGRYPGVIKRAFRTVDPLTSVWKTTQAEWVRWWHARRRLCLKVVAEGSEFVVTAENGSTDYNFAVEYWRQPHVAVMPLTGKKIRFSPGALAYENRRWPRQVHPVRIDRPEGLKMHLRRAIDWEKITPVEEIRPIGWRNQIKRVLRRWVKP